MGYTKDKNNKLNSEQIAYYDELLKTDKLDFDDKAIVCHSFFEYFKNQKEYKKAGSYLVTGNDAQYASKSFDMR